MVGTVGQRNTGTTVRFWPDPKFFDSDKFSVPQLKHVLKAKAVLCPGLKITFENEATKEKDEWFFTGDLAAYLKEEIGKEDALPAEPIFAKNDQRRSTSSNTRSCGRRTPSARWARATST